MIIHKRRHPLVRFVRQTFYKIYNPLKKAYWRTCTPKTHGVKVMVFNPKNELLLARIGYMHKLWVIPGGKIDSRETPDAAASRELFEGVGITIANPDLLFTVYHEKQGKKDTIYYFRAFSDAADFVIDDEEIVDVGWFALDALPELRVPRVDEAIMKYNEVT